MVRNLIMANKYNFSVQRFNRITTQFEIFGVEGMGSFDEARSEVEKGIRDQVLAEEKYFASQPKNTTPNMGDGILDAALRKNAAPSTPNIAPGAGMPGNNIVAAPGAGK